MSLNIARPLAGVVNASLMETMGRSLNTSLTTLFVLLALLLFGGPTIRGLLLVLATATAAACGGDAQSQPADAIAASAEGSGASTAGLSSRVSATPRKPRETRHV